MGNELLGKARPPKIANPSIEIPLVSYLVVKQATCGECASARSLYGQPLASMLFYENPWRSALDPENWSRTVLGSRSVYGFSLSGQKAMDPWLCVKNTHEMGAFAKNPVWPGPCCLHGRKEKWGQNFWAHIQFLLDNPQHLGGPLHKMFFLESQDNAKDLN